MSEIAMWEPSALEQTQGHEDCCQMGRWREQGGPVLWVLETKAGMIPQGQLVAGSQPHGPPSARSQRLYDLYAWTIFDDITHTYKRELVKSCKHMKKKSEKSTLIDILWNSWPVLLKLAETLEQKKKFRERLRKSESVMDLVKNNISLLVNCDIDTVVIQNVNNSGNRP